MKKVLKIVVAIVIVLNILQPCILMADGQLDTKDAKLDAVLVIDASLSMKTTDPEKLGLEAVKMFVDMLGGDTNQVGVVTYAKEAYQMYPMTKVGSQADKEAIKAFVSGIDRNLNYTDITSGLKEAVKMQAARTVSDNKPLIVVFTDGNNDITGLKDRTYGDIEADLEAIIQTSQDHNYPIYTVGLNANGGLNEAYLKDISAKTGAKSFVTRNPEDLPDILTQIFADNMELKVIPLKDITGTGDFEEVTINIPNSNVFEANISAVSSKPITLKLVDPKGMEQRVPSREVTLHTSNMYQILKIKNPMEGDWKLQVKGVKGSAIKINLVYNYELEAVLDLQGKAEYEVGEDLKAEAFFTLGGVKVDDTNLYKGAKASLVIKNIKTGAETQVDMKSGDSDFSASYHLTEEAEYEAQVVVEDASFKRESEKMEFKVLLPPAPGATSPPVNTPSTEKDTKGSGLVYIFMGGGFLLAAVMAFIGYRAFKRSQIPLVGQLVIELRDNTTGKLEPPQYKKLHLFKGKVDLHSLLHYAPEYVETKKIILKSAPGDKVILYNNSTMELEKAGRKVKAQEGLELRKNDKISLTVADGGQTVYMEYLL